MPENEFERKVQKHMEEFRIRPSEEVWSKVELELRKKKRRRVVFYISLLAGLSLLVYSGYSYLHTKQSAVASRQSTVGSGQSVVNSQQPTIGKDIRGLENRTVVSNNKNPEKTAANEGGTIAKNNKENKRDNRPSVDINVQRPVVKKDISSSSSVAVKEAPTNKPSVNISVQEPVVKKDIATSNSVVSKDAPANKPLVDIGVQKPVVKKDIAISNSVISKDAPASKPSVDIRTQETVIKKDMAISNTVAPKDEPAYKSIVDSSLNKSVLNDSVTAKITTKQEEEVAKDSVATAAVIQKKLSPKIKFGIEVSGGITSSRDELIGLFSTNKNFLDAAAVSAPGSGTNGNAGRIDLTPSPVNGSGGLKIGMIAELKLSKRSSLSSGLRYAYLSETIRVGSYKDTLFSSNSYQFATANSINSLYRAGAQRIYKSKYYFLELPFQYQYQLNKGKKLPILWNAGITPGYLLTTNALVYDTAAGGGGVYYHSNQAFKRLHFSFQTGLSFRFGKPQRIQWSLGPDLALDMTRLMKEDVFTKKRYFMYAGITGRMMFGRSKK